MTVAVGRARRQKNRPRNSACRLDAGGAQLVQVSLRHARRAANPGRPWRRAEAAGAPASPRPTRAAAARGGSGPSRPCGKVRVSGPSRENASAGCVLSNSPTAAATRASGSSGASRAASAYTRSADSCRPRRCSADAVEETVGDGAVARRAARAPRTEPAGGSRRIAAGTLTDRNEDGQVAREVRMEQVPCRDGVGGVRLELGSRLPRRLGSVLPGPELRQAEIQLHGGALRMEAATSCVRRATVPSGQRLNDSPDPGLERVVAREQLLRLRRACPPRRGSGASPQVARLAVDADAEIERERRRPRADGCGPRTRARAARLP